MFCISRKTIKKKKTYKVSTAKQIQLFISLLRKSPTVCRNKGNGYS